MADFVLTVGIDEQLSYKEMREGLERVIGKLNGDGFNINLNPELDKGAVQEFRKQITDLLHGISENSKAAVKPLQEIAQLVGELNQKPFALNLNVSEANSAAEALGRYRETVREYVRDMREAYAAIGRITGTDTWQKSVGNSMNRELANLYGGDGVRAIEKFEARLERVTSFAGAERVAKDAQQYWNTLLPILNKAQELGIISKESSFGIFPEIPQQNVDTAQRLSGILGQLTGATKQEAADAEKLNAEMREHIPAVEGAAEAERLKERASEDLHQDLEQENRDLDNSDDSLQRHADLFRQVANASRQAHELLQRNMNAGDMGTQAFDTLNNDLQLLDQLLLASDDNVTDFNNNLQALEQAGYDVHGSLHSVLDMIAAMRRNLTESERGGSVTFDALVRKAQQMQKLLDSNTRFGGQQEYTALQNELNTVNSILQNVSSGAMTLDEALVNAGRDGAQIIGQLNTEMAEFSNYANTASQNEKSLERLFQYAAQAQSELNALRTTSGTNGTDLSNAQNAYREFSRVLQQLLQNRSQLTAEEIRGAQAAAERVRQSLRDTQLLANGSQQQVSALQNVLALSERLNKNQEAWSAARNGRSRRDYAAIAQYIQQLNDLRNRLEQGTITQGEFNRQFQAISYNASVASSHIRAVGENTKSFSDRLQGLAGKFSAWLGASQLIMRAIGAIRQMVSTAIELDDSLTQLRIVTHSTSDEMRAYGDVAIETAKRVGTAVSDVVDSTTTYARLGFDLDTSNALATYTAMLSKVGDIDTESATSAVTAIVKAYDVHADELEQIMDKLVTVGNNFPISVSELAEGMNNAGSALHAAGNSIEQSLALLAAANTTVQNISKSSTGLRTITARIRNMGTELDELGEAMSEAEYENLVKALTKQHVALTDVNGEFRSTYDILSDIADVWKTMSTTDRAALAETLSGTRQQNVFFSIIESFQEASGAMEMMKDSQDELQEAFDTYEESVTYHLDRMKTAFTEAGQNLMRGEFMKGLLDVGTFLLEILDNVFTLINALGGLPTVLAMVGAALVTLNLTKVLSTITTIANTIVGLPQIINTTVTAVRVAFDAARTGSTSFMSAFTLMGGNLGVIVAAATAAAGILAAVIPGIVEAVRAANPSLEDLRKQIEELESKSKDLSDQLKTNQDRINELWKLKQDGNFTIVEQDELDKLKEENELIQAQIDLLKEQAKAKKEQQNKKAQEEAQDFLDGERGHWVTTGNNSRYIEASGVGELDEILEHYNTAIENHDLDAQVAYLERIQEVQSSILEMRKGLDEEDPYSARLIRFLDIIIDRISIATSGAEAMVRIAQRLADEGKNVQEIYAYLSQFGNDELFPTIEKGAGGWSIGESSFATLDELEDYLSAYLGLISDVPDKTNAADDSAGKLSMTLEELTGLLNTLETNTGKLTSALTEFNADGTISAKTLDDLVSVFGQTEGFDEFVRVIGDASTTAEIFEAACESLAARHIEQSGILDNVTEANAALIIKMLEGIGVTNANEVVTWKLYEAQLRLAVSSGQAEGGIEALLAAMSSEKSWAELSKNELIALAAQQIATANTTMDFSQQITALKELAIQAGVAKASLSMLAAPVNMNDFGAWLAKRGMNGSLEQYQREQYLNAINNALNVDLSADLKTIRPSYSFFGTGDTNSTTSTSTTSSTKKEVEEYLAELDEYYKALKRIESIELRLSKTEDAIDLTDSDNEKINLTQRLINIYEDEADALANLNRLRSATISRTIPELEALGFQISYNAATNEFLIHNMERINELQATSQGKYETMQEATNALRKETEELIGTLDELNQANQDGAESMRKITADTKAAKIAVIDYLKNIVTASSEAVDTLQSVYDILHTAADEYAAGGYITLDTLQSIIGMGAQYMQYLTDENGLLVINHERIEAVIKAKTEELALNEALSYVERLRLAMEEGSIEDLNELLYATTASTDATWGLVYANLALLGLDDDQYAAALHNINAIRALAENAMQSIGAVAKESTNELETMKQGLDDILQYVMEMLKHRIQEQIQALEDLKTSYGNLIKLRKESLETAKKESDYQRNVAKQVRNIAALQAKIAALSLDNSREAQAKRIKLEEELAALQEGLADDQADHAREAQETALDAMQKSYEDEKDAEIASLEQSISSTEKLYRMAIDYIRNNWSTLKDELIQWNYDVGSNFQSEIESAWEGALAAAQKYGDYVTALGSIDADIAASESAHYDIVGGSRSGGEASNEDMVHAIIKRMWANAQAWSGASKARQQELDEANLELGEQLANYGVTAVRDNDKGVWYVDHIGGEKLFTKYKKYLYHSGGIAGDKPSLKQNEVLAILEKGEAILDGQKERGLYKLVDFITALTSGVGKLLDRSGLGRGQISSGGSAALAMAGGPSIHFGDVYIYGGSEETAEKHRAINREFTNEVLRQLNLKR